MTPPVKDQPGSKRGISVGVLVSGGVESAALLSEALQRYERVYPIYVREGFIWEPGELYWLRKLLKAQASDGLADLTVLEAPMQTLYGKHWSLGKKKVPGFHAPDRAVYLPGRNLILLSFAGIFCALRRISSLWIGILQGNPFHDARSGFLREMEGILHEGLDRSVRIASPFRELKKSEVLRRFPEVPWELSFSCIHPIGRKHCGRCQKCAERKSGFKTAGVSDPTQYVNKKGVRSMDLAPFRQRGT